MGSIKYQPKTLLYCLLCLKAALLVGFPVCVFPWWSAQPDVVVHLCL